MRPVLRLKKEALTELTPRELGAVAGAVVMWTPWCHVTIELGDKVRELASLECG